MKRFEIRNLSSPKEVKPRVFDIVLDEDDEAYIEVKLKSKDCERVKLDEVMDQIRKIKPK